MGDQIRAVVFVVIALVILFAWGHFYKPAIQQPPPTQAVTQEAPSPAPASTSASSGKRPQAADAVAAAGLLKVEAANEKLVAIDNPVFVVEFSNRGGVVRSWKL